MIEHGNVAFDISPDGETLVFSDAEGDLWLFDLATKNTTRLTSTAEWESSPSWAPDGKTIVYVSAAENGDHASIFSRSIDDSRIQRLTNDDQCADQAPCFAPDGKTIAFSRAHLHRLYSMGGWTWDHYDIYLIDADGSNLHRLTNSKHYGMNGVSFSTDSQEVLFSADEDRAADTSKRTLFEVALDGTMTIHKPEMDGEYCAWITDPYSHAGGTGYVFISDRVEAFQYDVLVMDGDSKKPRSLGAISASRYNGNPVITRDGATVYFLAGTEKNGAVRSIYSLWSVNYDGSNMRQFADSSLFTTPASWLPTPPTD